MLASQALSWAGLDDLAQGLVVRARFSVPGVQLGGLLMWVPAIVPFMAAALWRLAQGLRRAEAAA